MLIVGVNSCINPFAPKLDENLGSKSGIISNQTDIEGLFLNFKYAYTFRDTLIYSQLLEKNFIFNYRNYDDGNDVSWSREEEMNVTYGLFQNTQRLDLIWNNITAITDDSTHVYRSFNLTVTFNPTDIIYVDGKVNLELVKGLDNKWRIIRWTDESNF